MKRFSAATVVVGLLVLPAGAAGVSGQDKENAARECRALKKAMGTENFRDEFGTNKNKRNAFGKCVSSKAKENKAEADEKDKQKINAAKACRAEQNDPDFTSTHDGKSFDEFYGTNENDENAFGKCVSGKARAKNG